MDTLTAAGEHLSFNRVTAYYSQTKAQKSATFSTFTAGREVSSIKHVIGANFTENDDWYILVKTSITKSISVQYLERCIYQNNVDKLITGITTTIDDF